jgi:hypothetical protein
MSADFDKAIDRAVREMLDVEPPAGLRQRVIERLPAFAEAPAGKPASGSQLPASGFRLPAFSFVASSFSRKIALPVAAAAVLVLGVFLTRSTPRQPESTTVSVPQPATQSTVTPPVAEPSPQVRPERPEPAPRAVAVARRSGQVVEGAMYVPAAPSGDIEPLQALAPIQVAPVTQRPMTQPDIAISPLNPIADLEIAPLNPPDRRN